MGRKADVSEDDNSGCVCGVCSVFIYVFSGVFICSHSKVVLYVCALSTRWNCAGSQTKYVNVFGSSKASSQSAPAPAPPPVMMPLAMGGGPFTGNVFVPTAAGVCVCACVCVFVCLLVCMCVFESVCSHVHAVHIYTMNLMCRLTLVHNTQVAAQLGWESQWLTSLALSSPFQQKAPRPNLLRDH